MIERDRILGLDVQPDMPQDAAILEDRQHHVISEQPVSLFAAIEAVEAEVLAREEQ